MSEDSNDVQRMLANGEILKEVLRTSEALRHRSEYDILNGTTRDFAVLCWALQESAHGTAGTCMTMYGFMKALENLRKRVGG